MTVPICRFIGVNYKSRLHEDIQIYFRKLHELSITCCADQYQRERIRMESRVGQNHRFEHQQSDIHRSHRCERFAEYHLAVRNRTHDLDS